MIGKMGKRELDIGVIKELASGSFWVFQRLTLRLGQVLLMIQNPEVEIAFGTAGKLG